jgi:cyclopropane fatty-acyl-phospholipid synthase-like methyltransferase
VSDSHARTSLDSRHLYDAEYFLHQVSGAQDFARFDGRAETLFGRAKRNLELLRLAPGERFLEIGCGRGEVSIAAAARGCAFDAVDYSQAALHMAEAKARDVERAHGRPLDLRFHCRAATSLALGEDRYDAVLLSEFIEHISSDEARQVLAAVHAALAASGRLLVYTYPNVLQRRIGYPVYRLASAARRGVWPPRLQEDMTSEHYRSYHLNEQSYVSLAAVLRRTGFTETIWYDLDALRGANPLRWTQRLLWKTPLVHFFGTDLTALARKR